MIKINREKVLRDVANLAYVAADIKTGRYTPHELHQTFDICEGENLERIDHIIAIALEELRTLLPNGVLTPLQALYAHEYVVARILADWFSITLPEASKPWQDKLALLPPLLRESQTAATSVPSRSLPPI